MRILTITLNPAIDQTITVDKFVSGKVHRARSVRESPGGKGINSSSCLADWGIRTAAAGFLGRDNAGIFEKLFAAKGIEDRFLRLDGTPRVNIKVVDNNDTTEINLPGIEVSYRDIRDMSALADEYLTVPGMAILSGSLPPGCPRDLYKTMTANLKARRCTVLLDADGAALTESLSAALLPDCIKPNRQELSQWAGRELTNHHEMIELVQDLRQRGLALGAISLGDEGALFIGEETLHAFGDTDMLAGSVGAGDAMMAGICAALHEGADPERTARLGTAFALARLSQRGPHLPEKEIVEKLAREVRITKIGK
ncbi:phosphofructokinase [Spirochaetia bacterium]|nr:phosphofructokinase [Spirochaetia bacterium]